MANPARFSPFILLLLIASVLTFNVGTAAACSCAEGPPTAPIDELGAAFVGTATELIAELGGAETLFGGNAVVRFTVDEEIKGAFGEQAVLLVSSTDNFTCGGAQFVPGAAQFGEKAGIQLRPEPWGRVSEACTQTTADYVRSGAVGLAPPDLTLEASVVMVGNWVGTSMRLLDDTGTAVAYIKDDATVGPTKLCGDGSTLVSLIARDGSLFVRWRDLTSLDSVTDVQLPSAPNVGLAEVQLGECVHGGRTLARSASEIWITDPDGTVQTLPAGTYQSGALSQDGQTLARWIDVTSFEVAHLDGNAARIVVPVTNHVGGTMAVSPDGTRFAFPRREPADLSGGVALIIVDLDGNELGVLEHDAFFAGPAAAWLDRNTIARGSKVIDFVDGRPVIRQSPKTPTFDTWTQPVSGTRSVVYRGPVAFLFDQLSGELSPLDMALQPGVAIALPAPIAVTSGGFTPPAQPVLPFDGRRVPATLKELIAQLAEIPDTDPTLLAELRNVLESSPEVAASDDDSDANPTNEQESGNETPTDSPPAVPITVGLLVVALVVGFVWRRRS